MEPAMGTLGFDTMRPNLLMLGGHGWPRPADYGWFELLPFPAVLPYEC